MRKQLPGCSATDFHRIAAKIIIAIGSEVDLSAVPAPVLHPVSSLVPGELPDLAAFQGHYVHIVIAILV
ncbi:hypothetical protein D9M68_943180 [compost metagenome]